jgi:hypothetical protein
MKGAFNQKPRPSTPRRGPELEVCAHPSTSWSPFKVRPMPLKGIRGTDGLTRRPWLELERRAALTEGATT